MSLARTTSWPRALASAVICIVVAGSLVTTSTAAAQAAPVTAVSSAATTPSPSEEPEAIDACGAPPSDLNYDLTRIPSSSNFSYFEKDAQGQFQQRVAGSYSTGGASSVTIRIMDNATFEYVTPDRVLNFPNTNPCGPEAANVYRVEIGQCVSSSGRTPVTGIVDNTADSTRKYLPEARVVADMVVGSSSAQHPIYKVLDGKSGDVSIDSHLGGLQPATYDFKFYAYGNWTTPVAVVRDVVPLCGAAPFPPGDPAGGGSSGDPSSSTPTGKLKQLRGTNIVCGKAINKKVKQKSVFRLGGKRVIRGKVVRLDRRIVVKTGQVVKIDCFEAPIASVVKLKVKKANGTWKVVKKLRVQRPGS